VVWVGVPTAAAAYLLWFVVGGLTTKLDHQAATFDQHQKDMAALIGHLQVETEQSWVMAGTLSRICLNTAKTDADRMACVTVTRRPQ
jgi:hypothetical protein